MTQLCVSRDMKHLESLGIPQELLSAPRATLTPLKCSPNFSRASQRCTPEICFFHLENITWSENKTHKL